MSYTTKKFLVAALIIFTTILLVGISYYFYATAIQTAQGKDDISIEINDVQTANDFSDMAKQADLIVLGHYKSHHSTMNLARDPNDVNKESQEEFIGAKIFRFHITEILKGKTEAKNIKIA